MKESSDHHYGRLVGFLRAVSLRRQFFATLEFFLLLASGVILILLGCLFVLEFKEKFPYLPFIYCSAAIIFLSSLLLLGLWRAARQPSLERTAKGLEEKFPQLKDDVTNSFLLFHQ